MSVHTTMIIAGHYKATVTHADGTTEVFDIKQEQGRGYRSAWNIRQDDELIHQAPTLREAKSWLSDRPQPVVEAPVAPAPASTERTRVDVRVNRENGSATITGPTFAGSATLVGVQGDLFVENAADGQGLGLTTSYSMAGRMVAADNGHDNVYVDVDYAE